MTALTAPRWRRIAALVVLAVAAAGAWAQQQSGGIYSCTDAHGRRITSDRPIPECLDRPQRELSPSGATRRIIPPSPTAAEREEQAARQREEQAARQRARDAIRRDQALLARYPDQAAHDADRRQALAQSQDIVDAAERRIAELQQERARLDEEMEFYRKDPSRAPAKLRRDIEDNAQAMEEQRRAIAGQQAERDRINARYDEEAAHLRTLWPAPTEAAAAPAPGSKTRR